ncbi:MAG: nucleotidyltransferase domain-containing protein [Acidobacteriia bacterium]|nr:nucleotidyltransferase domain-containing protein [Terriglobia bacterium]
MRSNSENDQFARLITSIEPWLGEVVIIGGWAHRLYRLDARAQLLDYMPVFTVDADIALPSNLKVERKDIRECLVDHGFKEDRMGEDKPPVTHYHLAEDGTGFYAEFLTPSTGGEHRRDGTSNSTMTIAGVVSQKLRFIEILLNAPWTVDLDQTNGFPFEEAIRVRIANPAAFLAHKLLIEKRRTSTRHPKDILYIHDTLETFGGRLQELNAEWKNHIGPILSPKNVRLIERSAESLFHEVTDPVREAALIASGRSLSPERIREICNWGLKQVFG